MEELIDNPIIIDKDFDYIGTGNIMRGKNPDQPIFKIIGDSLKVSITAVATDGYQRLIEYNDSGRGTLWILGCKASEMIYGASPNSSIVTVGCDVSCALFLNHVTSLNKITFNNYMHSRPLPEVYDYRIGGTNHILHNEPTPDEVLTFQPKNNLINSKDYVMINNHGTAYIGGFSGNPQELNLPEGITIWDCCSITNSGGIPKESIFVNSYIESYYDNDTYLHINPRDSFDLKTPIKFAERKKMNLSD